MATIFIDLDDFRLLISSYWVQETTEFVWHNSTDVLICSYCNTKLFSSETQQTCCKPGKVKLASTDDITELRNLFLRHDNIGKFFV